MCCLPSGMDTSWTGWLGKAGLDVLLVVPVKGAERSRWGCL